MTSRALLGPEGKRIGVAGHNLPIDHDGKLVDPVVWLRVVRLRLAHLRPLTEVNPEGIRHRRLAKESQFAFAQLGIVVNRYLDRQLLFKLFVRLAFGIAVSLPVDFDLELLFLGNARGLRNVLVRGFGRALFLQLLPRLVEHHPELVELAPRKRTVPLDDFRLHAAACDVSPLHLFEMLPSQNDFARGALSATGGKRIREMRFSGAWLGRGTRSAVERESRREQRASSGGMVFRFIVGSAFQNPRFLLVTYGTCVR